MHYPCDALHNRKPTALRIGCRVQVDRPRGVHTRKDPQHVIR
jgi:hypothetical protein